MTCFILENPLNSEIIVLSTIKIIPRYKFRGGEAGLCKVSLAKDLICWIDNQHPKMMWCGGKFPLGCSTIKHYLKGVQVNVQ